jgi:hypothetical protein
VRNRLVWLRIGANRSSCQCGNELSDSIKFWETIEWLQNWMVADLTEEKGIDNDEEGRHLGMQAGAWRCYKHVSISHRHFSPFRLRTNSMTLSPQVNYTDWATATCLRNLVPTFVDRGMSRGQRGGSLTVVNLSFLDRSRFLSSSSSFILTRAEWTPFQNHCYSENLVTSGIEPGICGLTATIWPLNHRGGPFMGVAKL